MAGNRFRKRIVETFVYPLYHRWLKRDGLYEWARFYEDSQHWNAERMREYRHDLLAKLLRHAYENVPYYSRVFDETGIPLPELSGNKGFGNIPFLTKESVRAHFQEIQAVNIPRDRFITNSTSGSTGSNFTFYSDKHSFLHRKALQARIDTWMGMGPADRELILWGASWDIKKAKKPLPRIKKFFRNKMALSAYHLSEAMMGEYYKRMVDFGTRFLHGYPSSLFRFADFLECNGLDYPVAGIRCAGETLFEFQRRKIEKVFRAPVFNFYSSREVNILAHENRSHDGLSVQNENVILEVVNEKGTPVFDEEGEIVVTDLHNYAMPFIRYKIGDRGILKKSNRSGPPGLDVLESVTGRIFDIVKFPNGNAVGGTFWTLLMRSEPGINYFQVRQKRMDEIEIDVVAGPEFLEAAFARLREKIFRYSGPGLEIKLNSVDSISLTKGGKFRFVVSDL